MECRECMTALIGGGVDALVDGTLVYAWMAIDIDEQAEHEQEQEEDA